MNWIDDVVSGLRPDGHVLIAGPTASGKSSLAMAIADRIDAIVVNADALQVYRDWRILTARPSVEDESRLPHELYGHVDGTRTYSVGDWIRDVEPLLETKRCVIVGGTGLYLSALTEGLADIPEIPSEIRRETRERLAADGIASLIADLDDVTLSRLDLENPRRVQRAWEVQRTTGRPLAAWQDDTPAPILNLADASPIVLAAPKTWLTPRIERRFEAMIASGVLDEARENEPAWHAHLASSKAIGARELVAHVRHEMSLDAAREAITIQTRQYAKRQRNWFRARMQNWHWIDAIDV